MHRGAIFGAFLAMGLAAGVARAASQPVQLAQADAARRALPVEGVITNPDWLTKPGPDDLSHDYPPFATAMGIEGYVILRCAVSAGGTLANCEVPTEAPKGLRFGAAALKLANLFRMKPMTVDGSPVSGAMINIPIRFRPQQTSVTDFEPDAASPPPSAKAMALAKRVATVTTEIFSTGWKSASNQWKTSLSPLSSEEQTVLEGYDAALPSRMSAAADQFAAIYARTYSEAELAGIVAFFESPPGHAWLSRQQTLSKPVQAVFMNIQEATTADMRARVCPQIACPAPRPPPQPAGAK